MQNSLHLITDDKNLSLQQIIPISRSCRLAGVKSGRFPKPVKLSAKAVAWRSLDIQTLLDSMKGGAK